MKYLWQFRVSRYEAEEHGYEKHEKYGYMITLPCNVSAVEAKLKKHFGRNCEIIKLELFDKNIIVEL